MIDSEPFGATGHSSSRVIFGAAALGSLSQSQADVLLPTLLEFGVNHLDTASSYGESELRLAPWLAAHPGEFFLATKTGERDSDGARASLERSLTRLGVEQIDLIQLHNLVEEEDFERAHGPSGALEGLQRAREEGLVRFIGVTGHGLRIAKMHLRSLERFPFDSVLLPYNRPLLKDSEYARDVEELLSICEERSVAVQTIKSIAKRRWSSSFDGPRRSWYEPIDDRGALQRAVAFVLSRDKLFLNSSSDYELLRPILEAASSNLERPSDDELDRDAALHEIEPLFDGDALERI